MNAAAAKIAAWRENPVLFVRDVIGIEPDPWQVEVLEATARGRRICLKASKGPGKSALLSWIGWWFMVTRLHPKCVAISITADNLRDNLWTELAHWQNKSPLLSSAFKWTAERIFAVDHPETWWISARSFAKTADANEQANALAGVHADNVLFLVDEVGGFPDAVVATAEAGLANADESEGRTAKLVMAGNPTQLSGPLHRACTRERHLWWIKEISGDPDDPNRAPRVSIQWAREQIEKYGRDSNWVRVNVFGQFPLGQSNALIGADDANTASRRNLGENEYGFAPKVLGVDVALFGDDRTVLYPRQGRAAFRPRVMREVDNMGVAGQIIEVIRTWGAHAVFVDVTGGTGSGVVSRLQELGYRAIGIQAAGKAAAPHYLNKRIEMWDAMAEWIREGGAIPDDGELVEELTAPTYWFRSDGKKQLEGKDEIKERLGRSPDLADALALTFAMPVAIPDEVAAAKVAGSRNREYRPFERRA